MRPENAGGYPSGWHAARRRRLTPARPFSDERLEGPYKLWRWPLRAVWTQGAPLKPNRKNGTRQAVCGKTACTV